MYKRQAMDVLQPYMDSGKLVVKSGQTTFEQVATANWDSEKAQNRMDTIIAGNYSDGTVLNAVLCSNDSTALGVENALASSYTGEYPIITGQDCDIANVKNPVSYTHLDVYKRQGYGNAPYQSGQDRQSGGTGEL